MMHHRTIRRFILTLLMFACVSSFVTCSASADVSAQNVDDFRLLADLGVFDESGMNDDKLNTEVSRGDAARYIANFLGLNSVKNNDTRLPYIDMNSDDENYGSVCALYSAGIISKNSEFRSNDKITSLEALKMIAVSLGYEELAAAKGGYPSGYVSLAARLRLSAYTSDTPMMTKELFELLKDSVDLDVMDYNGTYIETSVGVSILERYRGILDLTGVITANQDTDTETLDGTSTVNVGKVRVNGKILKDSNAKAYDLIGIETDIYYDKNTEEIISALPQRNIEIFRIFAHEIESVKDEYTIVYYDDERNKSVSLSLDSKNVIVMKNGQYTALYGKADLDIDEGYIELYDTDSDGVYEIAKIVSPSVYVVDKASSNRVYFKYGKMYNSKNYIEKDNSTTFYIDGKEVGTDEFVEWDIINIYKVGSQDKVRVESEYRRVSGILTSVTDDAVEIDGKKYDINPNGYFVPADFEIGASIDTYLDLSGRIYVAAKSAVSSDDENLELGYICRVETKEELFGGGKARFKMYKSDMEFEWLMAASKLKIYGKEDKNGRVIDFEKASALSELQDHLVACGDGVSECQIVKYKVDADNNVTTVYCAIPEEQISDTDEGYPLILSYDRDSSSPTADRHAYTGTLNFAYSVNWGFNFWNVPENKDEEELYNIVLAQNMGISGSGYTFDQIKLFNVNSNGAPEFALKVSNQIVGTSLDDNSPTGVITKVGRMMVNDEDMSYLKVYSQGSVKTLYMDDDFISKFNGEDYFYKGTKISDLTPGDVIAFKTNEKSHINALRILVRNSDRGDYRIEVMKKSDKILTGDILEKPTEVIHLVYGEITDTDGGAQVKIQTGADSITPYLFRSDGQILKNYTVINTEGRNPSIELGTASDICVGDKVAFRWTWKGIDDVFIYKD